MNNIYSLISKPELRVSCIFSADITGSMSGKGKISRQQAFNNAESSTALHSTKDALEQYACLLYQPGTSVVRLKELQ